MGVWESRPNGLCDRILTIDESKGHKFEHQMLLSHHLSPGCCASEHLIFLFILASCLFGHRDFILLYIIFNAWLWFGICHLALTCFFPINQYLIHYKTNHGIMFLLKFQIPISLSWNLMPFYGGFCYCGLGTALYLFVL